MITLLCRRAIGASLVAWAFTACASVGPYTHEPARDVESTRIANLCETVMGLRPSERPVSGTWPGDTHLPSVVSHYDVCVISLSDSLHQAQSVEAARLADASCRAQGLSANSPELAVCVLQSSKSSEVAAESETPAASNSTATTDSAAFLRPVGSFFYASASEASRREQTACAELGLEPPGALFTACVKNLSTNLFAIDNPIE